MLIATLSPISSSAIESKFTPDERKALERGIVACQIAERNLKTCERLLAEEGSEIESPWKSTEAILIYIVSAFTVGLIAGGSR